MSILTTKIKAIPTNPGCYLFKNQLGKIIYVGKAKNLNKRVKSYFKFNLSDPKTRQLMSEATDVDFIVTDSELEALLLEARLIKTNQPRFNLDLKSGVRYAYIKITNELLPRLETTRIIKRGDKVFGPYALASTRRNLLQLATELFKLRSGKTKPVFVGQLYKIRCATAPWVRWVALEEYQADIKKVVLLLQGKTSDLIGELQEEMRGLAQQQRYELARIRRDQIGALQQLADKQKVQLRKAYDQDVINAVVIKNQFIVQLFNINKGVVSGRKQFKLKLPSQQVLADVWSDFLRQYYYNQELPQEIILPNKIAEQKLLEQYLTKLAQRKVIITVPKKGDKLKLLNLVKKNILISLKRGDSALFDLQTALSLPQLPITIECFDVSNLGSSQIVGSLVCFKDGLPDKNNYRHFKIKWQQRQSDFDAMREIVFRRYYRATKEKTALPDLVLVDGGKPQLTAAKIALRSLGLTVPVAALAKKHEELFIPGQNESIKLDKKSAALKLVQKIRDEAHHFAITYHRLLRSKAF